MARAPLLGACTDLTPALGTLFGPDTQLTALLDDDEAVRALGTLVAHRGVVFFQRQNITLAQQKVRLLCFPAPVLTLCRC